MGIYIIPVYLQRNALNSSSKCFLRKHSQGRPLRLLILPVSTNIAFRVDADTTA